LGEVGERRTFRIDRASGPLALEHAGGILPDSLFGYAVDAWFLTGPVFGSKGLGVRVVAPGETPCDVTAAHRARTDGRSGGSGPLENVPRCAGAGSGTEVCEPNARCHLVEFDQPPMRLSAHMRYLPVESGMPSTRQDDGSHGVKQAPVGLGFTD